MPRLGTKQGGCLACGLKEGASARAEVRLFAIAENAIVEQARFLTEKVNLSALQIRKKTGSSASA